MSKLTETDILADMHTHTIFSKHAFSTIKENLEAAKEAGLKYIAITDHYYRSGDDVEQKNEINRILYQGKRVEGNKYGIAVISSVEANLNHPMRPSLAEKMKQGKIKYRPIGLHSWFVDRENLTLEEVQTMFFKAHTDDNFNVFNHIEREIDRINHGKYRSSIPDELQDFFVNIVRFAKKNNVLLEVNESSLTFDNCGNKERLMFWIQVAKENGNKIVIGSDAHYCEEVGRFDNVIALLNEVQYPKELIINCNEDMIQNFV